MAKVRGMNTGGRLYDYVAVIGDGPHVFIEAFEGAFRDRAFATLNLKQARKFAAEILAVADEVEASQ